MKSSPDWNSNTIAMYKLLSDYSAINYSSVSTTLEEDRGKGGKCKKYRSDPRHLYAGVLALLREFAKFKRPAAWIGSFLAGLEKGFRRSSQSRSRVEKCDPA